MLNLLVDLPVELVGTNVIGVLCFKDIVMLERACGSKKSHQLFRELLLHTAPIELHSYYHNKIYILSWFEKRQCRINSLFIHLPGVLCYLPNLKVDFFDLEINFTTNLDYLKPLQDGYIGSKVRSIYINENKNQDVIEQLSVYTWNVSKLDLNNSFCCIDWLSVDILSRWKLEEICIYHGIITNPLILLIVQTCKELTSIELNCTIDDDVVITITQHCPKLETLLLRSNHITWTSLLALSERGLPLKELKMTRIPNIPTADIARRCSHALSCIRELNTHYLEQNGQDAIIFIPYMTGLTSLILNYNNDIFIPLLTQNCHKLTTVHLDTNCTVGHILSLCHANPLLQDLIYHGNGCITDAVLIELVHACPHLHKHCPY